MPSAPVPARLVEASLQVVVAASPSPSGTDAASERVTLSIRSLLGPETTSSAAPPADTQVIQGKAQPPQRPAAGSSSEDGTSSSDSSSEDDDDEAMGDAIMDYDGLRDMITKAYQQVDEEEGEEDDGEEEGGAGGRREGAKRKGKGNLLAQELVRQRLLLSTDGLHALAARAWRGGLLDAHG